jgi:hypothetical protein
MRRLIDPGKSRFAPATREAAAMKAAIAPFMSVAPRP